MVVVNKNSKILITGASGFVGQHLVSYLNAHTQHEILCLVRKKLKGNEANQLLMSDISLITESDIDFNTFDVVIHLAGKAHAKEDSVTDFYNTNTQASINLAAIAAKAGVKRFIFLSSIGVNGTLNEIPFSHLSKPAPADNYAKSKLQAEIELWKIAKTSSMELVIIRPPLVYGPSAPGNFGKLVKLVKTNLPLPFGSIATKRSFVAIDNLISLIECCIHHPKAANQTFLVSDDEDITLPQLLNEIGRASGKRVFLIPFPVTILKLLSYLANKKEVLDKMCGQLQVDISFTKETLSWKPTVSFREGINRCFQKERIYK